MKMLDNDSVSTLDFTSLLASVRKFVSVPVRKMIWNSVQDPAWISAWGSDRSSVETLVQSFIKESTYENA